MRVKPIVRTAAVCGALFGAALLAMGCSFNPLNYMSRNACEVFNCDEMFFIEDILPLSAGPESVAASGGGMVMAEAEDEGGGHAH